MELEIFNSLSLSLSDCAFEAVKSSGPGGQNVNKVSTSIHLRFDIHNCSLPLYAKQKLLKLGDTRVSKEGVLVIKASSHRTQRQNKKMAINRLIKLIQKTLKTSRPRRATGPTRSSKIKRLDSKARQSEKKRDRGKVWSDN